MAGLSLKRLFWLPAISLLLYLFVQAIAHARMASLTVDEGAHIAAGYAYLRTGDLRLQPIHVHPPLANALAAAPLLLQPDLPDPRQINGWEAAKFFVITDTVVWQYPDPARMALATRLPIIGMTLLLAAIVYRWAADLWGPRSGLLALFLLAFDPNIIAHGSLVTTDMAVTLWGTATLFLAARALSCPRWGYVVAVGITLGLALASKVSAISLIPALLVLVLVAPIRFRHRLEASTGALTLSALVLWAIYRFEVRFISGFSFPLPAATHLEIYRYFQEHYLIGHPAFLMGQNSHHGWWYYFPIAFALKTPLPTLLLALAGLIRRPRSTPQVVYRLAPISAFPLLYLISSLFSTVNIGYRHLLPVLPFLFILAGRAIRSMEYAIRSTYSAWRIPLLVCLAWLALGTLRVAPNYLAFFNELAGGPAGGYRYLVDSNLDWGQNLWQLRDWMRENGIERVFYAHYSPACPEVYGISVDWLPPASLAVPFSPLDPAPGIYAIGATVLQGVYTPDTNTYAWFRIRKPLARLGYALFLYRVEPRPASRWVALCTDTVAALSPDALQTGLGSPDLRVALVDCSQAWVSLAPGPPGVLALPPEAEPPPGAALDVPARRDDGRPLYNLWRLETAPTPEHPLATPLDGPLDFAGYSISRTSSPKAVELWTFWRVKERPARPLSLMGYLLGADGIPAAVAGGMGFPTEFWQSGDLIIQRHRLSIPTNSQLEEYTLATGVYWLDTMERWKAGETAEIPAGDRILLPWE